MTIRKSRAKQSDDPVLLFEPFPPKYDGPTYLTLIRFRDNDNLCVVDNHTKKFIQFYNMEKFTHDTISKQEFVEIVDQWDRCNRVRFPLSIEFSRRGLTNETAPLLQQISVRSIERYIGAQHFYDMQLKNNPKRKKVFPESLKPINKYYKFK